MIAKLLHKIKSDQKFKTKRQKCSTQFISLNLTEYWAITAILLNHLKLCPIWSIFENVVDEVMSLANLILWKIIFIHYSLTHMYKPTVSRFSKLYIPNASNKYILYQILRWVYIVWDTSPLKQILIIRKIPNILSMSQATRI